MRARKRYKVVQDGNGRWGILDTFALAFPVVKPFAEFGNGKWLDLAWGAAIRLNTGETEREHYYWIDYTPRSGS